MNEPKKPAAPSHWTPQAVIKLLAIAWAMFICTGVWFMIFYSGDPRPDTAFVVAVLSGLAGLVSTVLAFAFGQKTNAGP